MLITYKSVHEFCKSRLIYIYIYIYTFILPLGTPKIIYITAVYKIHRHYRCVHPYRCVQIFYQPSSSTELQISIEYLRS